MWYDKLKNSRFNLIAGPCVLESEQHAFDMSGAIKDICNDLNINFIYKTSFDKANRTSKDGYRGVIGEVKVHMYRVELANESFGKIKKQIGCEILTDVHESWQPVLLPTIDIFQIPAFLCRQTDLIVACAETGKPTNIKKGQFTSPESMVWAVEKHGGDVMLTERGTFFGYGRLVVDMAGLIVMRKYAPVIFDATHSVQQPTGKTTKGNRLVAPFLARAALAVGVDGLFMEVHDDPDNAPSDGPNMIRLKDLQGILETLLEYATLTKQAEQGSILGSHSPFYMNTNSNYIDEYRRQKPLEEYTIEEYKFDPPESFTKDAGHVAGQVEEDHSNASWHSRTGGGGFGPIFGPTDETNDD